MSTALYFNLFDDDSEANLVPFFSTQSQFVAEHNVDSVEPDSPETEIISGLFG